MSERMSDEELLANLQAVAGGLRGDRFGKSALCRIASEARRAREEEVRANDRVRWYAKQLGDRARWCSKELDTANARAQAAVTERDAERARAEMAESELAGLRESGGALTAAIAQADAALDEFASHHPREDGRHLPFPQCVREAMTTLRGRIATLEAERMELRAALAARTCPAVHASAHGLLVCTREHGHARPCAWRRKRPEEKCPVCTGACEWDKDTTG